MQSIFASRQLTIWRTHSEQAARKTAHSFYQLRTLLRSNLMSRRLGKLIPATCMAAIVTYVITVLSFLTKDSSAEATVAPRPSLVLCR